MTTGKSNKSIKNNPEFFSDELQTPEERILEKLEKEKLSQQPQTTETYFKPEEDVPQAPIASAQERITDLLDKYCNGDHDVEYAERFNHQEEYKQELISFLKQCGITYVTRPHFPLTDYELHVIRMDFFGRIRQPNLDRLGSLYKAYLNISERGGISSGIVSKQKNDHKKLPVLTNNKMITYPIEHYSNYLNQSPAWKIYRLFPRFHHLEYRMLKTIQAMHIPPEQLPLMNVYDYSDVLYRAFRKSEKSRDAHLFLGARQAFAKDVFRKNEAWLRNYLERKKIHPRYIDALIKSAQSKGITNGIHIASDTHTFMSEYAAAYSEDFQNFIIHGIKSDNYANTIKERIYNNSYSIEGSALNFLKNTQKQLTQFIKKNLLEENYAVSLYEQFSRKIPSYVLEDIKGYIKENPQQFIQYLNQLDISPNLQKSILKNLPDFNDPEQRQISKMFILENQDNFFEYLMNNCRSVEYAQFALKTLDETPKLTDFGKDMIYSFILEESEQQNSKISPILLDKIKENGLTDNLLIEISPYIRNHFSGLTNHFKKNNILTFTELRNELIENNALLVQNNSLPTSMNNLHKSFVLSNIVYFKDWYINFHTQRYRENATEYYIQLQKQGITRNNAGVCCDFIRERLSSFMEFATQQNLSSSEIFQNLKEDKLVKHSALSEIAHNFIVRHNSTFKNFLLQNHLQQKEKKFDLMIKKIKQQGITEQCGSIIHKFIIDNQPLYTEYQRKDKQLNLQAEQIYNRIISNKPTSQDKAVLNEYLNNNIYNYMIFQQDNSQLLPYVKNIIQNIKHTQIGPTEEHWLKAYCSSTPEKFNTFLTENHYLDKEKSEDFVKNIKFAKKNIVITYTDNYVLKIDLEIHHKFAAQDSGEIKSGSLLYVPMSIKQRVPELTIEQLGSLKDVNSFDNIPLSKELKASSQVANIYTETTNGNIAQANDFSKLCFFPTWWHKIMHCMDRTESFDNKERFVERLMPTDPNIIFFGSEKPEDQLCYDYANDQRTKRYKNKLTNLIAANQDYER